MRCDIHASNELGGMVVRVERSDGFGSRSCIKALMVFIFACGVNAALFASVLFQEPLGLPKWWFLVLIVHVFPGSYVYLCIAVPWSGRDQKYVQNIGLFRDVVFGQINQSMIEMRIPESIIQRGGEALKKD